MRALGGSRIELRRDRLSIRHVTQRIHALRGDNPELRAAIRLALADAVSTGGGLPELGRIAMGALPIPAYDLHPAVLGAAGDAATQRRSGFSSSSSGTTGRVSCGSSSPRLGSPGP